MKVEEFEFKFEDDYDGVGKKILNVRDFTGIITRNDWSSIYMVNGYPHGDEDLPAIRYSDGTNMWYKNGLKHRGNNPAVIGDNHEEWWLDGKPHREGGPAIVRPDGSKRWYVNGELHREDGPAVIRADGSNEWWINGEVQPVDLRNGGLMDSTEKIDF